MLTLGMYEWGQDPNCLVFEIRSCMGVVVRYGNVLYGVHVPDTPRNKQQGRDGFLQYLAAQVPMRQAAQTHLYSMVNGIHRGGGFNLDLGYHEDAWELEMMPYGRSLGVRSITMVRVERFLKLPGAGPKSLTEECAIACHLDDHAWMNRGCRFTYHTNTPRVPFGPGGGPCDGHYATNPVPTRDQIPASMVGWHDAEDSDPNAVYEMKVR
jgi:hypothetical protein